MAELSYITDDTDRYPPERRQRRRRKRGRRRLGYAAIVLVGLLGVAVLVIRPFGSSPSGSVTPTGEASAKSTGAPASTTVPKGSPADVGTVRGVYTLHGPDSASAGAWAVLTLSGQGKRVVKVDTEAPFRARVDTRTLPDGLYTFTVLVVRPGSEGKVSTRMLHIRNTRASPTSSGSGPVSGTGSSQASQVVALTNQERAKAGCKALTVSAKLTSSAQAHSNDMAKNNYFEHNSQDGSTPFDRITDTGYRYSQAAENIAMGQVDAQAVTAAWMNSSSHRANILNCSLTQIGVGYAVNDTGTPYWTQDFATPA
jgi:uncharacterized protein YkwD